MDDFYDDMDFDEGDYDEGYEDGFSDSSEDIEDTDDSIADNDTDTAEDYNCNPFWLSKEEAFIIGAGFGYEDGLTDKDKRKRNKDS